MIDPELKELLDNCSTDGEGEFWKDGAETALSRTFGRLTELLPPEEVRELIESIWFAAKAEYGD